MITTEGTERKGGRWKGTEMGERSQKPAVLRRN